jgi:hypothetical protein
MTKLSTMVCTVIAAALSVRGGAIVYNNIGATGTGTDPISSFGPLYDSFSTGLNFGPISLLDLFVGATVPTDGDTILVALYADSSTSPGSLLASLGTISDSGLTTTPAAITVSLTSNPVLASGTRYWIGLSSVGSGIWQWSADTSGTGVSGEFFANHAGVFPNNTDNPYQMEVQLGSSVPEPSMFAPMVAGLSILLAFALRGNVSFRFAGPSK